MERKITIYTKPNCTPCNFTKKYLDERGIEYKLVDVTTNAEALELIKENGYQGVPVVTVDGFDNSWQGFRPDRLEELKEVAE